ncbi:hypothetical protein PROFUN_09609 [Planoprotostelium fungivorum]|uniref:Uncharacterized protein n=1 Tax=Planoprotostelium fungivorum TaxID=1890364 RepID=A0A2P6MNT1_9EUKA|nr:hypothetical protein PROFUN_09609 [Planoprotostelium fungivorum]
MSIHFMMVRRTDKPEQSAAKQPKGNPVQTTIPFNSVPGVTQTKTHETKKVTFRIESLAENEQPNRSAAMIFMSVFQMEISCMISEEFGLPELLYFFKVKQRTMGNVNTHADHIGIGGIGHSVNVIGYQFNDHCTNLLRKADAFNASIEGVHGDITNISEDMTSAREAIQSASGSLKEASEAIQSASGSLKEASEAMKGAENSIATIATAVVCVAAVYCGSTLYSTFWKKESPAPAK